jgi:hypothetical protein
MRVWTTVRLAMATSGAIAWAILVVPHLPVSW